MSMNNEPFAIVQVRLTAILPLCIDKLGKGSAFPGVQRPFLMINSLKCAEFEVAVVPTAD